MRAVRLRVQAHVLPPARHNIWRLCTMDPQVAFDRLIRLLRLDTTVFEEARDDPAFTYPAIAIAAISFFIAGLGGWLWWAVEGYGNKGKVFAESTILGSIFGVILWAAWIGIAYVIL